MPKCSVIVMTKSILVVGAAVAEVVVVVEVVRVVALSVMNTYRHMLMQMRKK